MNEALITAIDAAVTNARRSPLLTAAEYQHQVELHKKVYRLANQAAPEKCPELNLPGEWIIDPAEPLGLPPGLTEPAERYLPEVFKLSPEYFDSMSRLRLRSGKSDAGSEKKIRKATAPKSSESALVAILGPEGKRIYEVALSNKKAEDRMREICVIDQRCLGWDSPEWAEVLRVSDAAVRRTDFWKELRKGRSSED